MNRRKFAQILTVGSIGYPIPEGLVGKAFADNKGAQAWLNESFVDEPNAIRLVVQLKDVWFGLGIPDIKVEGYNTDAIMETRIDMLLSAAGETLYDRFLSNFTYENGWDRTSRAAPIYKRRQNELA